jgi:hypothetical protein
MFDVHVSPAFEVASGGQAWGVGEVICCQLAEVDVNPEAPKDLVGLFRALVTTLSNSNDGATKGYSGRHHG